MKYAHYNNSGDIIGFFDDSIHAKIPQPSIEISEAQWTDCINNPNMRRIDPESMQVVVHTPPLPSPAEHAAVRLAALRNECHEHITGGVICYPYGNDPDKAYTYPTNSSTEHPDQQNLNTCIYESLLNEADSAWRIPLWCADPNGIWDRRLHTHSQIRHVGSTVAKHIRDAQERLKSLSEQLNVIVTDTVLSDNEKRAAIDAVTW